MVEENINIGSLQQGSISETGTNISSTEYIRTKDYVNGVEVFRRGYLECFSTKPRSIEGSTEGITDVRHSVPAFPSTLRNDISTANNGNYEIYYYHYYIHHDDSYYGDNVLWWAGYIALLIPKIGSNVDSEKPWVKTYKENEYPTSSANYSTKEKYYESIDVEANTITYYNSGQSGETTTMSLLQFICGSLDGTYHYQAELRCWRLSDIVPCDVALLGYTSTNLLVYSERWKSGEGSISNMVDFLSQSPIIKWKFAMHVDGITNLKTDYICKHSFTFVGNSWELNEDDILVNADIPDTIDGNIFTPPYPATIWYLDKNRKLVNALLPEPYEERHNIVHDNPDGMEYFNYHSNVYDSALSNLNNNYRIRLEILTGEETVIGEITKDLSLTAAGQITINYEQITRRSCSLSLINVDNKYIPTKNSPFWLNRKFKLWLGLVVGKDTYWWSQGIFYTVSANAAGRILSIEGVDKGGALDGTLKLNMTEAQYQFKRGKALTEMIKQTLALDVGNPYGANNSPIGFGGNRPIDSQPPLIGIEYYGFNTVADISIDANSYISEMFVNMADLYAADCYYNTNGNLVFEQHIDSSGYNYVPTQWSFTDLSSTFEDVNYEYSYEGENVVTVYTNTTEAGVRNVAWTAYNTNPLSPLNVATGIRRAAHIEIPYYHNEQLSQDQQEAQQIKDCRSTANHYLLANSMLGMTLNFNAPIIPHMDVNKTIQISDQYADIEDGIYVVQSITIPLSSDKMQISATNINWLPNDMIFSGVSEIVQSNNNQNGGAET